MSFLGWVASAFLIHRCTWATAEPDVDDRLTLEFRADGGVSPLTSLDMGDRQLPPLMRRHAGSPHAGEGVLVTDELLARPSPSGSDQARQQKWKSGSNEENANVADDIRTAATPMAEDLLQETSRLLELARSKDSPVALGPSFDLSDQAYSALQQRSAMHQERRGEHLSMTASPPMLSNGEDSLNVGINQRDRDYIESAAKDAAATRDTFGEPPERPPQPAYVPSDSGLIKPSLDGMSNPAAQWQPGSARPAMGPYAADQGRYQPMGQLQNPSARRPYLPHMPPMMMSRRPNIGVPGQQRWPPREDDDASESGSKVGLGFGIGGALVLIGAGSGFLIWYFKVREQKSEHVDASGQMDSRPGVG